MAFNFIDLPYANDALEPYMSKKTLEFHYGKHYNPDLLNLCESSLMRCSGGREKEGNDKMTISTRNDFNYLEQWVF